MTDIFEPIDKQARDRIANDIEQTLFVEAGAGTGKTTALVARILSLVKAGNEIGRIAAITFTEAAAAELRDRVRRELEKAGSDDKSICTEERSRCSKAAEDIDNAPVQTLHSFAGSLLRQRPLEAGLPPGFEVVEEIESGIQFEERWQQWLDQAMNSPTISVSLTRSIRLGLSLDSLKEVAIVFHENYDLLSAPFPMEAEPDLRFSTSFVETMAELAGWLTYAHNGEEDPLVRHCRSLAETARRIEAADAQSEAGLVILGRVEKISKTAGKQADWDVVPSEQTNACKIIKDTLKDLQIEVTNGLCLVRRATIMPVLEGLRVFALDYAGQRRIEGRVQFQDLLIWARDLLKDCTEIRRFFQEKFSHILIDEFQDTDPIQAEIAFFLAEDPENHKKPEMNWQKVRLKTGKLFVVGDPKQSIYRFRRADIQTVGAVKNLIVAGDTADNEVPLVQNFRSQSSILDWVNNVFQQCMNDDGSGCQAAYLPLEARWQPQAVVPALGVHYLGGALDFKTAVVRRQEAASMAQAILDMKLCPWQVREENGQNLRPLNYRDICILVPTRTGLPALERALNESDIPYRIESQSLLLGTPDVKELLACLRAVDAPSDRVALVAALRSSAFAIDDVQLLQFVENGGKLDYTSPGTAGGPVREALDFLAVCHQEHIWQSPLETIEGLVRERAMEEVCSGRSRPRERLHRIQFVIDKARAFSEVQESSLRGFLDWIERLADENARMVEVPVPESDENAVRIMTIHASKGREFPMVVLMGIGSAPSSRTQPVLFNRRDNSVEISIGTANGPEFATAGYEEASAKEKLAEEAERVRLMYVAATRAKDHLVISLFRPLKKTDNSFANRLETLCRNSPGIWHPIEPQALNKRETQKDSIESRVSSDTELDRNKWLEERRFLLVQASQPVAVSATAVASVNKDTSEGDFPSRTGRGGTKLGRAVHSVLQTIDLAGGSGLPEIAAAQAANEGIPERATEVVGLVKNALGSEIVRRAIASGRSYREVFVSAPLEKGSVDGFIDLLFEEEGGFVIVDYKTDSIGESPSEAKRSQYALQAGIYALAARRVTSRPVKEVVLLFLKGPQEISFKNLDDLITSAGIAVDKALG